MEWPSQTREVHGLCARAVSYKYRYCPRCRCEWPARQKSCPECVHWLGDQPLERTEWQLAPAQSGFSAPQSCELIGASALILRLVWRHVLQPTSRSLNSPSLSAGFPYGCKRRDVRSSRTWLASLDHGRIASGISPGVRNRAAIGGIAAATATYTRHPLGHLDRSIRCAVRRTGRPRDWRCRARGPFSTSNLTTLSCRPRPSTRSNRRWEHFVCVPRRLLDGQELSGYRTIGHKRPSALDHAEAGHSTPFVGRERQLSIIEDCWRRAERTELAITAPAWSGKTRLIKEWLRGRPEINAIAANFSLFGGDVENFASQLAELPPDRLDCSALGGSGHGPHPSRQNPSYCPR